MSRWIYSSVFYLGMPLVLMRLLWRATKQYAYIKRWPERFGFSANSKTGVIWFHSVSVGETIAAVPLIKKIQNNYPQYSILVTTTTPTGSERVKKMLDNRVYHVYCPYDLPGAVQRFLNGWQPCIAIIMETELWPNLIHYSARAKIPVIIANARLSAKSAQGYGKFPGLMGPVLKSLYCVAVQNPQDGDRFLTLGLQPEQLEVTGSIKFDLEIDAAIYQQAEKLRAQFPQRPVLVAASTHQGEDEIVLSAFKKLLRLRPDLLLILVPRHPERFNKVFHLLDCEGLSVVRRSDGLACQSDTQVLLGDSMGEMLIFYGAADIAFIGGSFIANGGHNMLEAAAFGLPVISGPSLFNFQQISDSLVAAGAMNIVKTCDELAQTVGDIINNKELSKTMGKAGQQVLADNQGAMNKLMAIIKEALIGSHDH